MSDQRVQSVERSVDILMSLADSPKTLTEVTRATGLSKGTTFRLLGSLGYQNLVVRAPQANNYMLGPGFLRLVQGVLGGIGAITGVAKPTLVRLWEETKETISVHVRVGIERVCVEELPSPLPIRYTSEVGATASVQIGSAGKILLAFMDNPEMEKVVASLRPEQRADGKLVELDALYRELETVRRQGWATSSGERIVGAAAVSVPVCGSRGFLASLSVLGPTTRLPRRRRRELVPLLQVAAAEIEDTLASVSGEARDATSGRAATSRSAP